MFKKKLSMKNITVLLVILLASGLITSRGSINDDPDAAADYLNEEAADTIADNLDAGAGDFAQAQTTADEAGTAADTSGTAADASGTATDASGTAADELSVTKNQEFIEYKGASYKIITVAGGDLSGARQPQAAVDIGYGDRTYWAFTNEYGQLVYVTADEVTLQESSELPEGVNRYYGDEAKVPGTEQDDLDEGHVIADSLGGVSNAYNITPQNSVMNRYGDQAYMEKVIMDAGGCEDFAATITYPDTATQIPSHYKYEYIINGLKVLDEFDNLNPDEENASINSPSDTAAAKMPEPADTVAAEMPAPPVNRPDTAVTEEPGDITGIDTNGNGQVTIAEAKAAGFAMPIHADHWLYQYMHDGDGDGMVGE